VPFLLNHPILQLMEIICTNPNSEFVLFWLSLVDLPLKYTVSKCQLQDRWFFLLCSHRSHARIHFLFVVFLFGVFLVTLVFISLHYFCDGLNTFLLLHHSNHWNINQLSFSQCLHCLVLYYLP
jgi:hypothetical protein